FASSVRQTGQHSYGAAAADIDMDGDLDVLMINPFCRHRRFGGLRILKNEDGGRFADWTDGSGVYSGGIFGATFGDVNGDGFPDLFVGYQSCDRAGGEPPYYGPTLYINDGTGRFIDRTDGLPLSYTLRVSGVVFADFDNNGSLDLYAAVYEDLDKSRPARNRLLLNDGTGVFRDVTEQSGAGCLPGGGSALAEDFDNDGDVDLYVIRSKSPNVYLQNTGGGVFEDFTVYSSFLYKEGAIGGVAADVDGDGDVDVALMSRGADTRRLLKNNMGGVGSHLDVTLRGIRNNRSGLGAKIRVYEAGHIGDAPHLVGFRELTGGKGFRQWGPPVAHFGLGPREMVDVEVAFPPVDGEPSLVVHRLGVSAGQTIEVWEYRSLWERIRHNRLLAAVTDWVVSLAYTVPLGLLFIVVIGSVLVTGMRVRTRVGPVKLAAGDVAFGVVTIAAVGVGMVRSWPLAAGVAMAGAVIVLFYRRVAVVVLKLLPRKTREKMEDEVLADIHGATHLEGMFHFFHDIQHMSARELTKHVDRAVARLRSLVLKMRVLTPNNSTCRVLREEIAYLKFLTASGPDGDVPTRRAADASDSRDANPQSLDGDARWRKDIQEMRDRIRTHLAQYRVDLRGRMSIDPLAAWRGVLDDVSTDLAAAGVRITADMQGVDPGVRVHLRPQEFNFIFKNLIYNSLEAMRDSDAKQVHVRFARKGSQLVARWADTGCGVPSGFEKRLGVEPVRSSSNGSGQGLYRSNLILSNREGRIRWEEPAVGEGAVFVVKLLITSFDARASGKPV
ncbi:MAG: FG-GAP-like repeat-containing protein, partial [bacterium]